MRVHDGLDGLFAVMRWVMFAFCVIPLLFKVDVDSAFRRVLAAFAAFVFEDATWAAGHLAMPFGAASSMYA